MDEYLNTTSVYNNALCGVSFLLANNLDMLVSACTHIIQLVALTCVVQIDTLQAQQHFSFCNAGRVISAKNSSGNRLYVSGITASTLLDP